MKRFDKSYGPVYAYYVEDIWDTLLAKEKRQHPYKLFYKVIKTYIAVYFEDFYKNYTKPIYCFIGGSLTMATQRWKGRNMIKYLWYMRLSMNQSKTVRIKKLIKTENLIHNLDRNLREETDVSLFPHYNKLLLEKNKAKKSFLNAEHVNSV